MQINLRTIYLSVAVIVASTAIASAQGGMTDHNGDSIGSQHIGGTGTGGAMRSPSTVAPSATVGSATRHSMQDAPNGSAGTPPKAKAGPQGDASKDEDAPR